MATSAVPNLALVEVTTELLIPKRQNGRYQAELRNLRLKRDGGVPKVFDEAWIAGASKGTRKIGADLRWTADALSALINVYKRGMLYNSC